MINISVLHALIFITPKFEAEAVRFLQALHQYSRYVCINEDVSTDIWLQHLDD